jgi:hypothetical protein
MKFMLTFTGTPDPQTRAEVIARFQKTGGLPSEAEGVKLLGRWTRADLSGGFALLEADDPKRLAAFAYLWSDLMDLKIFPVLDDQELMATLQKVVK